VPTALQPIPASPPFHLLRVGEAGGGLTSDGGNEPRQLRDPHKRRHLIPTRRTATIELLTLEQGCRGGKETLPAAKEREHLERRIPARHGKGDSDWNHN